MPVDRNDLTLSEKDRKQLTSWALACADRLLVFSSSYHLVNRRLSIILEQAKGFGSGEIRIGQMRTLALECHQIARDCDSRRCSYLWSCDRNRTYGWAFQKRA